MNKKFLTTRRIAHGAIIAAVYVVLCIIFQPISYGPIQFRIAEALTIMPLFTPAAIPGLFVGCILANIIGQGVIMDVIFGSLATLIGAVLGYLLRRNRWLVPIPAVVANALIIPFVLRYGYGFTDVPIALEMLYILAGEVVGCYILGELLATILIPRRKTLFKDDAL
ncbi:MAG: QueT transporter family protein [Clostridia bacterium]|nr:QueT transporter family protein [Clostridia bacterium]